MNSHFIKRNNRAHSQSFSVRHVRLPHFIKLWHHHQELELVYIIKGEGTRFIGDSMEPFGAGDLVLLGDYLPHKWQNNPKYFEEGDLSVEAIIIHFEKSFLSNALTEVVEFKNFFDLIRSSARGIYFKGASRSGALQYLKKILDTSPGLNRMICLIDFLRILAEEKEFDFIVTPGYINSVHEKDGKLRIVNDYVMNNFQSAISLDDIANEVCMNKTAFCRYFKKVTHMNFSTYLNEIRVGYACKLLQADDDSTVASICFASGFNNLSNFNQKFKQYTGYTPSYYSKAIR